VALVVHRAAAVFLAAFPQLGEVPEELVAPLAITVVVAVAQVRIGQAQM
jgi:hypothetical protein